MLSRRDMLKTTAMAAPALLHFGRSRAWALDGPPSPAFPPFLNRLRPGDGVPPVLAPVSKGMPPDPYSGWPVFEEETVYYDITMTESNAHVLPDPNLTTKIWGYDGLYPGPTIEAELDKRIVVRFRNNLGLASRMTAKCHHNQIEPRTPFEYVATSIHHHGGHTVAASDGHPLLAFGPMGLDDVRKDNFRDYIFANTSTRSGTLWYHDHCEDDTARNVFYGLAGFYLLRSADEDQSLRERGIVLPKGERVDIGDKFYGYKFDVPLVIQDRLFHENGLFNYPLFNHEGVLGDVYCVNGKAQPRLAVEPRRYRFRLLNGSNARVYEFALGAGMQFLQIGTDGGLLPKAVRRASIKMAPAERVDVVIDFTGSWGNQIVLYNILEQTDGRGPADEAGGVRTPIMRFDVDVPLSSPDTSRVPGHLEDLLPLNADRNSPYFDDYRREDAVITRDFRIHRRHGVWVVNGSCYDPAKSSTCPPVTLDTTEIWRFHNSAGGWVHPMHVHLEEFKILSRNGVAPGPHEAGLKDTFLVGENETVEVITKFRDQPKAEDGHNDGLYVFHCHNLEHEDMAMMGQMLAVRPDGAAPSITRDFKPYIPELSWPVKCQEPL
jgi:FtsP/CotA-like multicopper oxidase with cupredoxin domain